MQLIELTSIKGIGPRRAELLGKLGLASFYDLLYFAPRDYKDYSRCERVGDCVHGQDAAVCVHIDQEPKLARVRKGLSVVTAQASDGKEKLNLVWFNQPYRKQQLQKDMTVYACGRMDFTHGRKMMNPTLSAALPGILPVYPLIQGVRQSMLRDAVRNGLAAFGERIEETLPLALRQKYAVAERAYALRNLHFPSDMQALREAKRRLAFEDMLTFRLMIDSLKQRRVQNGGVAFMPADEEAFAARFPFSLTAAQKRVLGEIAADMRAEKPMNRLIQGDVGSGKTVLALYAMATAVENGYQAILMAPTEILAVQHFGAVRRLFGESACLLRGGMKKQERETALALIASGRAHAIVGTHALLQSGVAFFKPGVVIADEQHRFGVRQRALLGNHGTPDVLIMSATPIPRTLALLLYGDLDVSVLNELPPGRKPIQSSLVPQKKREAMYDFLQAQIDAGRQAYVVCPLVEPSEALEDVHSAKELYEYLKGRLRANVGLLHGQMKNEEKEAVSAAFRDGAIDVLVSTTVIEVGVDVANAAIMVIENADRFGLAQLHQLRGRVGRGAQTSYCFLLAENLSDAARERLETLVKSNDGFAIAQKDLAMRGPGELLGKRQHGLSAFSALALANDMQVLKAAENAAADIEADAVLRAQCGAVVERARAAVEEVQKQIAFN